MRQALQSLCTPRPSNQALNSQVIAALIEPLPAWPAPEFGTQHKIELGMVIKHRDEETVLEAELHPQTPSPLQLFELPEGHQVFLQRLQRNGPKSTMTVDAAEDFLTSVGLDKLNEIEIAHALLFMA